MGLSGFRVSGFSGLGFELVMPVGWLHDNITRALLEKSARFVKRVRWVAVCGKGSIQRAEFKERLRASVSERERERQ